MLSSRPAKSSRPFSGVSGSTCAIDTRLAPRARPPTVLPTRTILLRIVSLAWSLARPPVVRTMRPDDQTAMGALPLIQTPSQASPPGLQPDLDTLYHDSGKKQKQSTVSTLYLYALELTYHWLHLVTSSFRAGCTDLTTDPLAMEVLLLENEAFVRARHREIEVKRRAARQKAGTTHASATVSLGSLNDSEAVEEDDDEVGGCRTQLVYWARAEALDALWATSNLERKLVVLSAALAPLYSDKRLATVRGTASATAIPSASNRTPSTKLCGAAPNAAGSSYKTAESESAPAPQPFEDLPLATQLGLRVFFRFCASLDDPTRLAASSRVLLHVAARLPALLADLPPFPLSPGFTVAKEAGAPTSHSDTGDAPKALSVFQSLFRLLAGLLELPLARSKSGAADTLGSGERAAVLTAYLALCLKWGSLRHLLCAVRALLTDDSSAGAEPDYVSLEPLFADMALAAPEPRHHAQQRDELVSGYLMSFGKGDHGKLGHGLCSHASCTDGNCTENKPSPTLISATRDTLFCRIDSLSTHSVAVTSRGQVMAWGNGDKFRLGHGSATKEYAPRVVESISARGRVVDISCGLGHTLVLLESGEMFAWGNGSNGRLGLGDTSDRAAPTMVCVPSSGSLDNVGGTSDALHDTRDRRRPEALAFRHVYCGASHSLALGADGRVFAWGKNNQGQCGHGRTNDQLGVEEVGYFRDKVDEDIVHAAGGWEHTLFCSASGRVYSAGCGYKDSRRAGIPPVLGHGDCERRIKPTVVQFFVDNDDEIVQVACGWDHSMAISATGRVYTWGSGTNGKLGHGDEENCSVPTLVRAMDGKQVRVAKAGCEHSVLLTEGHEVWTFGQGDSGRLGHGDNATRKEPTRIEAFAQSGLKPVAIAVGDKYNLVLVDDSQSDAICASVSVTPHPVSPAAFECSRSSRYRRRRSCNTRRELEKKHQLVSELAELTADRYASSWVLAAGESIQRQRLPANSQCEDATKSSLLDAPQVGNQVAISSCPAEDFLPQSRVECILFLLGHIDRLSAAYYLGDSDAARLFVHDEHSAGESGSPVGVSPLMLPYAIDTSREAFGLLLEILQTQRGSAGGAAQCEGAREVDCRLALLQRMCIMLSCLRIIKSNLSQLVGSGVSQPLPLEERAARLEHACASTDVGSASPLEQMRDLVSTFASTDANGVLELLATAPLDSKSRLAAPETADELAKVASAVSHEAAHVLQVGAVFAMIAVSLGDVSSD
ncbi:hypothetical protein PybrP1_006520 [[Pythium] brassicae (nom. inval.)]|nr:hypothetical protein PybrP1_006520 [[Pythium] brassicae (nom. inval.)]